MKQNSLVKQNEKIIKEWKMKKVMNIINET